MEGDGWRMRVEGWRVEGEGWRMREQGRAREEGYVLKYARRRSLDKGQGFWDLGSRFWAKGSGILTKESLSLIGGARA